MKLNYDQSVRINAAQDELYILYTCIHGQQNFQINLKEHNMAKTSTSSQDIYVWIV